MALAQPITEIAIRGQLSGDAKRSIKAMSQPVGWRGAARYGFTFVSIAAAIALHLAADHWGVTLLAIAFIGARQHSLYVLNHDAAHGILFASPDANRWVATALSTLPFFHHPEAYSYVQWRRRHLLHHRYLFTDRDLDYQSRIAAGDTTRSFSPGGLALELLRTALMSPLTMFLPSQACVDPSEKLVREPRRSHLALLFRAFPDDPEMEQERRLKLVTFALLLPALLFLAPATFFWMWIVPMYSVYPAVLRLMDLTEHALRERTLEVVDNTRSTRPGPLGAIFVSDCKRSYHREHHMYPAVPYHQLPRLSSLMQAETDLPAPAAGLLRTIRELA